MEVSLKLKIDAWTGLDRVVLREEGLLTLNMYISVGCDVIKENTTEHLPDKHVHTGPILGKKSLAKSV